MSAASLVDDQGVEHHRAWPRSARTGIGDSFALQCPVLDPCNRFRNKEVGNLRFRIDISKRRAECATSLTGGKAGPRSGQMSPNQGSRRPTNIEAIGCKKQQIKRREGILDV